MESPDGPAVDRESGADDADTPDQYVLYPIFESHERRTFEIARDIAAGADATLLVLDLYARTDEITGESRRVSSELLDTRLDDVHDVSVETRFEQTDHPVDEVITVARGHETSLIVFDEHTPDSLVRPLAGDVATRISDRVPCDVVSVAHDRGDRLSSILVPIAGGPHTRLAVAIAGAIGRSSDSVVELFHVTQPDETDEQVSRLFERARERLPAGVNVDTWQLDPENVADAIVEQSNHYDLTVVGEPKKGRLKRFLFGSITDHVSDGSQNTVLVARSSDGQTFTLSACTS